MSTPKKRLAAITAAGLLFAAGAGGVALASWTGSGTGNAFAKATALPTGPTPSAPTTTSQTSTSITVTWPKVQYVGTSADVTGYVVKRYNAGSEEPIGGTCSGTQTGVTCTDSVGGAGTYSYSVTPKNGSWTGTEGPKSQTVTVTAASAVAGLIWSNVTVSGNSVTPTCTGTIGSSYSCTTSGGNNATLSASVTFADSSGSPKVFSTSSNSTINIAYAGKNAGPSTVTVNANTTTSTAPAHVDKTGSNSATITATFNGWTAVLTVS